MRGIELEDPRKSEIYCHPAWWWMIYVCIDIHCMHTVQYIYIYTYSIYICVCRCINTRMYGHVCTILFLMSQRFPLPCHQRQSLCLGSGPWRSSESELVWDGTGNVPNWVLSPILLGKQWILTDIDILIFRDLTGNWYYIMFQSSICQFFSVAAIPNLSFFWDPTVRLDEWWNGMSLVYVHPAHRWFARNTNHIHPIILGQVAIFCAVGLRTNVHTRGGLRTRSSQQSTAQNRGNYP